MSQTQLPIQPPTGDDPKALLGWFVALLLGLTAFLWRIVEKGRADLKLAHADQLTTIKLAYTDQIATIKESNARERAMLEAELAQTKKNFETMCKKVDEERARNDKIVEEVSKAVLSRRTNIYEPGDDERDMPTEIRRRTEVVPRSMTPTGTRPQGRYSGPG